MLYKCPRSGCALTYTQHSLTGSLTHSHNAMCSKNTTTKSSGKQPENRWLQPARLRERTIRGRKFQVHEYSTRINGSTFGKLPIGTSSLFRSYLLSKTSDREASTSFPKECWMCATFSISTMQNNDHPSLLAPFFN